MLIRGGRLVLPDRVEQLDIRIDGERIVEIGAGLAGERTEIDATGLHVFPAGVDVHMHLDQPGSGNSGPAVEASQAAVTGGVVTLFDLPLHSTPCTLSPAAFDRKRQVLEATSLCDFGIWGGLVPGAVPGMAAMAARGVVGFKAFMCDSGVPAFPRCDNGTLLAGLREAARLDLPVAVHAESQELATAFAMARRGRSVRDFLDSRPVIVELEAIQRALLLAEEANARLHIVQISSGQGVAAATAARARGVDVTIGTCPHYLAFTEEDVERIGAAIKCTPPLRSPAVQAQLWSALVDGQVDLLASDHLACAPALKTGDFVSAFSGIAGVQSMLGVMLRRGHHERGVPLACVAALLAAEPARRFRLRSKGRIAVDADADLALVDVHARAPVMQTLRRGETIFLGGRITASAGGRLVRPAI